MYQNRHQILYNNAKIKGFKNLHSMTYRPGGNDMLKLANNGPVPDSGERKTEMVEKMVKFLISIREC